MKIQTATKENKTANEGKIIGQQKEREKLDRKKNG